MAKITQDVAGLLTFDDLMANSLKEGSTGFKELAVRRVLLLISLSAGLDMSSVFRLKWKDLLSLGSENDAIVKDELIVRKYSIAIHPKAKQQISDTYALVGFPERDTLIISQLGKDANDLDKLPGLILMINNSNRHKFLNVINEYLEKCDFNTYTQVCFGRKVFQVMGYTTETCRALKQHLGFRSNQALFDFLGYSSKEEIVYRLHHINLDCKAPLEFKDKNFNDGLTKTGEPKHPFQKFTAFSKFLLTCKTYYSETVTNSIYLLLWLSLYNGVRPSTLIRLKWKHIMDVDKRQSTIGVCDWTIFEGYTIKIGKELRDKLLYHFEISAEKTMRDALEPKDDRYKAERKVIYRSLPDFDTPVFIMNSGNAITQPSLSREIKKALQQMGFPHADKFTSKSTAIMYGRRVLEIKGNHKPTIQKLKEHFNFKSAEQLFDFLYLDYNKDGVVFKSGRMRKTMFEEVLYDI
ncbi:hypothetical protein [Flavobacterium sp.]|uniref:hypothetical protein n=1 Tax=Flavobacterium sp. TaxID=239 RepID=UPI00403383F5